jgi:hypothetical protein
VSQVWLGMTAGCAVCHDHKYDPLTQRQFYEMAAFFNNTTQGAMDGNIKDTLSIVKVPLESDRARFEALASGIAPARERVEARRREARPDFERWLAAAGPGSLGGPVPSEGLLLRAPLSEGEGNKAAFENGAGPREVTAARDLAWEPTSPARSSRAWTTARGRASAAGTSPSTPGEWACTSSIAGRKMP